MPAFSPAQHWRAKTRLFPSKAAASEDRYVEGLNDTRTLLGERCVLAHRGWVGENRGFFSILLVFGRPNRRSYR
jgi:hypothetical protein